MCDTDLYSIILSLNNTSKEFIESLDVTPENMVSGPVFYDEEDEVEKEQNTEEPVEDETDSTEAKDSENVTLLDSVMEHGSSSLCAGPLPILYSLSNEEGI